MNERKINIQWFIYTLDYHSENCLAVSWWKPIDTSRIQASLQIYPLTITSLALQNPQSTMWFHLYFSYACFLLKSVTVSSLWFVIQMCHAASNRIFLVVCALPFFNAVSCLKHKLQIFKSLHEGFFFLCRAVQFHKSWQCKCKKMESVTLPK